MATMSEQGAAVAESTYAKAELDRSDLQSQYDYAVAHGETVSAFILKQRLDLSTNTSS